MAKNTRSFFKGGGEQKAREINLQNSMNNIPTEDQSTQTIDPAKKDSAQADDPVKTKPSFVAKTEPIIINFEEMEEEKQKKKRLREFTIICYSSVLLAILIAIISWLFNCYNYSTGLIFMGSGLSGIIFGLLSQNSINTKTAVFVAIIFMALGLGTIYDYNSNNIALDESKILFGGGSSKPYSPPVKPPPPVKKEWEKVGEVIIIGKGYNTDNYVLADRPHPDGNKKGDIVYLTPETKCKHYDYSRYNEISKKTKIPVLVNNGGRIKFLIPINEKVLYELYRIK